MSLSLELVKLLMGLIICGITNSRSLLTESGLDFDGNKDILRGYASFRGSEHLS